MKTTVDLDDDLVREAQRLSHAKSRRGLIEEALRTFVTIRSTEDRKARYVEALRQLEPKLKGLKLSEPPLALIRADRDRG